MKPTKVSADISPTLTQLPVNLTINSVDSKTTLNDHIDADSTILTSQLAILMQVLPSVATVKDLRGISDQVMKVLKARSQLCLKPTCKDETENGEIDITPMV